MSAILVTPDNGWGERMFALDAAGGSPPLAYCRHDGEYGDPQWYVGRSPKPDALVLVWRGELCPLGMERLMRLLAMREGLEEKESVGYRWQPTSAPPDAKGWALIAHQSHCITYWARPQLPNCLAHPVGRKYAHPIPPLAHPPSALTGPLLAAWALGYACEGRGVVQDIVEL